MSDRIIQTFGEIYASADGLNTNKFPMIGQAKLAEAILGNGVVLNGLACTPTGPASLNVIVAPGEIYSIEDIDATPYGDLPADTTHQILKQGVGLNSTQLPCAAPGTLGYSINYLVQFAFLEQDGVVENRSFFGPPIYFQNVNTVRQDLIVMSAKAGTAALTGTQVTPAPDPGFTGGYVVTVANGQTTILSGDIVVYSGAPFLTETLQDKISLSTAQALFAEPSEIQSGQFLYGVDVGITNTLVVLLSPTLTAYTAGSVLTILPANPNTGATTINIDGHGAKNILNFDGSALQPGQILAAVPCQIIYNGTAFILQSAPPRALSTSVTWSGTLSVPNTTIVVVPFDAVEYDQMGLWDSVNFRWVATRAGYYELNTKIHVANAAASTANFFLVIYKNGNPYKVVNEDGTNVLGVGDLQFGGGGEIPLAVNDYIDVRFGSVLAQPLTIGGVGGGAFTAQQYNYAQVKYRGV